MESTLEQVLAYRVFEFFIDMQKQEERSGKDDLA